MFYVLFDALHFILYIFFTAIVSVLLVGLVAVVMWYWHNIRKSADMSGQIPDDATTVISNDNFLRQYPDEVMGIDNFAIPAVNLNVPDKLPSAVVYAEAEPTR